jgi:hypothetical protein
MNPDIDVDDDGPPMLVEADDKLQPADIDDTPLPRVPITIITGMKL